MKTCSKCEKSLSKSLFSKNKAKKGGLNSYCRECNKAYQAQWYKDNTLSHRNQSIALKRRRIENSREGVMDYLSTHYCVDCGETDSVVLEFDHVRGKKKDSVCAMVSEGYLWKTIQEEIAKCEVRCANCHRRKTANDFGFYKTKT